MQRYITGQVTEQEKIKIEAWLDVKKTDEGTDMVLNEEDEEKLFSKITANIDNVEKIKAFRPARAKVRTLFSSRWFQIAATLLILAVTSYTIWLIAGKDVLHQTVAGNNMEKAILEDGTIVWLQKESRLTYVKIHGIRQATLRGEGLFEVAKDPASPFVISWGALRIKVIGTSFNLKTGAEGIELKVLTGKVNLSSTLHQHVIEVAPNEMAIGSNQGEVKKVAMGRDEVEAVIVRTEYNMEFRNATLKNIVDRIKKKFDVQVMLEDPGAGKCRITADFTDQSLQSTLDLLRELLDINFSIEKSTVTITGKGCY